MKNRAIIIGILLCAFLPLRAAAENFAGEDSLVAKLPSQRLSEYLELTILMNPLQMRQYLMLSTERDRSRWIRRFWAELDPTPTTNANERRTEHERRILLAREHYASAKAPGWDNRGEVLIRYGAPANVTKAAEDITASSYILSGETWYYLAPRMTVYFQRNLAGEYVCSGDPVSWVDYRPYRVPDEPDYCADALLNQEIAEMMSPDGDYHPEDWPMPENEIYRNVEERPFIHSCDLEEKISCYIGVATFRNADRSLRTEVSFEVPSNEIEFFGEEGDRTAAVEFRVLVRDSTMRKIAFERDRIRISTADSRPEQMLLPGQVALHLKPGHYRMGLEAYDSYTKKRAAFLRDVEIAPLNGSPEMSDIQFASSIRDAEPGSRFAKGDLQVVPHPVRAYRIPFPVSFYFEIYGLDTDEDGKTFYRVEYRIVPLEKRRRGPVLQDMPAIVSSTFESSGYGATQPQRLSIATDELWEGPFRLDVTVTDRRSFRTAAKSEDFSVLK